MKLKQITAAVLCFIFVLTSLGSVSADETAAVSLSSLNMQLNVFRVCYPEDEPYNVCLKVTPISEISEGSTIVLNFENASVLDEIPTYYGLGQNYFFTYDNACRFLANGASLSSIYTILWRSSNTDDSFIPWNMTKLSDTSVEVDLFPITDELCNVNYGDFSIPYYYLPLPVRVLNQGTVSVSVESGDETSDSFVFAYVLENENEDVYDAADEIAEYITIAPDSSYTWVNKIVSVNNGDILGNYLSIIPDEEVEKGSSIILTFENAYVPDELPDYESLQGNSYSYDECLAMITESGMTATNVLNTLWAQTSDVYIPWKMTKISDRSIKVELFPILSVLCDVNYIGNGHNNKPFYYLPLNVYASGPKNGSINLVVNQNDSSVSSCRIEGIGKIITGTLEQGDVNASGSADLIDAVDIMKYTEGKTELDDESKTAGDMDGNDSVNEIDAALLLKKLMNG